LTIDNSYSMTESLLLALLGDPLSGSGVSDRHLGKPDPPSTGASLRRALIAFLAYCSQMTLKQCLLLHAPGLTPAAVLEELPRLIPKHLTG
jgi:hypothetical protein